MDPQGWVAAFQASEALPAKDPDETVVYLRSKARNGVLEVRVQRRPIMQTSRFQPPGDVFVRSTWSNFDGRPEQSVDLILRARAGAWYWSGALFGVPP